ncbi:UxaA family hydrolase [Chloroflexota bacterium]
MKRAIMMHPKDNVATALDALEVTIQTSQEPPKEVTAVASIPFGHKIALAEVANGAEVIKYGEVIGMASKAIGLGEHAHVHNVVSARFSASK